MGYMGYMGLEMGKISSELIFFISELFLQSGDDDAVFAHFIGGFHAFVTEIDE